jgi:hypothetical protein
MFGPVGDVGLTPSCWALSRFAVSVDGSGVVGSCMDENIDDSWLKPPGIPGFVGYTFNV